jgi:hypothetical protein
MRSIRTSCRRRFGWLLVLLFAFGLGEALMPEACDGDNAGVPTATADGRGDSAPSGRVPGHGGPHVCHCTHAGGVVLNATLLAYVTPVRHETAPVATLTEPRSCTLQPAFRPPII